MADQLMKPAALGLDIDGTLVKSHTAKLLPGVERALLDAGAAGIPIFLATNQAGPVWRAVSDQLKYPTAERVAVTLAEVARQVAKFAPSARLYIAVSAGDPALLPIYGASAFTWEGAASYARDWMAFRLLREGCPLRTHIDLEPFARKPNIGMVLSASADIVGPGKRWPRGAAVYVGDMETDRQLAEAAGLFYLPADEWRAGHLWRLWQPPKPEPMPSLPAETDL